VILLVMVWLMLDILSAQATWNSGQGHVMPDGVAPGTDQSASGCYETVSRWAEVVVDGAERPQEALCVLGGSKRWSTRSCLCRRCSVWGSTRLMAGA
jgi:hypothetical protein